MKKAIALLVAITTVFSVGLVAFADGGIIMPQMNTTTNQATPDSGNLMPNNATTDSGTADNGIFVTDNAVTNNGTVDNGILMPNNVVDNTTADNGIFVTDNARAGDMTDAGGITPFDLEWSTDVTGNDYLTIGASEMYLVWADGDDKGSVVAPDTVLIPGNDYTFNIYYANNDITISDAATATDFITKAGGVLPVTKGLLADGRLRVRTKGSAGVVTATIDDRGSGSNTRYNLDVTTREQYGTKINDIEFTLTISAGNSLLSTSTTALQVGWPEIDDDEIDSYAEDDIIVIYNDEPVITNKQFQRLAKNYNYKAITFENEDGTWNYTSRVSGNSSANFYNTEEIVEEIIMKHPDQDYKFVNFHAGVKFATNGEMRIDVSDINGDFARMYLYLYRNGVLTPITATYDSTTAELAFRTNYLGAFVITDEEIDDLVIMENGEIPEEPVEPEEPLEPPMEENNNNNNANTGMDATMNLLATLGLAAVSGGSIIRRKRK